MTRQWLSFLGIITVSAPFFLTVNLPLQGDDFQGAAKLIEKLSGPSPVASGSAQAHDSTAQIKKDLATFTKETSTLSPEETAKQWLALFDRSLALSQQQNISEAWSYGLGRTVLNALPSPAIWPELQKQVEARPPEKTPGTRALLLLIVHTLNNAEDKQWSDLALMNPLPVGGKTGGSMGPFDLNNTALVMTLGEKLSDVSGKPDEVEKFWDRTFRSIAQPATSAFSFSSQNGASLNLPDLVTLLGAKRAEPLLLQALTLPHVAISQIAGKETQRLARKLALDHLDKIQQAPWFLTQDLEGSELYEALIKKFPADSGNQVGAIYHVLALAIAGKQEEAVQAAASIDSNQLESASQKAAEAGYAEQIYDFLHTLLKSQPESDSWSTYIELAAQTGHAPEALQFVKDTLAQKDLSLAAQYRVRPVLYCALLAVDQVDAGIEQLRLQIKTGQDASQNPVVTTISSVFSGMTGSDSSQAQLMKWDLQLSRLGHVLKRAPLEAEALKDAQLRSPKDSLIDYLIETGHDVEAEKLLIAAIVEESDKEKAAAAQPGNPNSFDAYGGNQRDLIKLTQVYYHAGRWADILTLLQQAPGWQASDLLAIAGETAYSERYSPHSVGLMTARALAETGHVDQARPILNYTLHVDAGDDAAYALLLKIGQGDLVAQLDALYKQDQFQNRPLIWKATLLLQQGKIAEAEQTCKAAITVDPSDGETGKGDRMRVYSVMADICEAKKDTQQATFFHNIVKAIRLSEDADDFYDAGLLTQAVDMYAKALGFFSNAYCIQSRIARQLTELGRTEEAAAHYRKAFELMPVSFGRMESHCFGCERAFKGKTAVDIAQKTFSDMLAKDPKNPRIHYLLGYLHMEEEEYPEAVANFQKAAELDPDYINAWKQLMEIGNNYQLSPDLRDAAVFNILRLDPAGHHISPDTSNVRDLIKLWSVEQTALKAIPPTPESLFSLTASAREQKARADRQKSAFPSGFDSDIFGSIEDQLNMQLGRRPKDDSAPRKAILDNGIITTALPFFR